MISTETKEEKRKRMHAYYVVAECKRKGWLIPEPCYCGRKGEAHHNDYDKPLDIVWLCRAHHRLVDTTIKKFNHVTE